MNKLDELIRTAFFVPCFSVHFRVFCGFRIRRFNHGNHRLHGKTQNKTNFRRGLPRISSKDSVSGQKTAEVADAAHFFHFFFGDRRRVLNTGETQAKFVWIRCPAERFFECDEAGLI